MGYHPKQSKKKKCAIWCIFMVDKIIINPFASVTANHFHCTILTAYGRFVLVNISLYQNLMCLTHTNVCVPIHRTRWTYSIECILFPIHFILLLVFSLRKLEFVCLSVSFIYHWNKSLTLYRFSFHFHFHFRFFFLLKFCLLSLHLFFLK